MGICRNEIYWCNLKESYKYCLTGIHPVIIISSFKHLLKNDLIQVIPVTSNVKKVCKSHIEINQCGLKKNSKIECEQILTVNRIDLKEKIGKISNVKMFEVNNILKQHLQLDGKFKNLESVDLEELFFKGEIKMGNKRELNILKSRARLSYLEEDYEKCIDHCSKLIDKTKLNEFLWYGYYAKSLSYMKLNKIECALKCAESSLKYINVVDVFSQDFCLSMQCMARCYADTNIDKSIEVYKTLSNIYREATNNRLRLSCIFNIASLKHNLSAMKRLINIVENTIDTKWYFFDNKEQFLENMKFELSTLTGI